MPPAMATARALGGPLLVQDGAPAPQPTAPPPLGVRRATAQAAFGSISSSSISSSSIFSSSPAATCLLPPPASRSCLSVTAPGSSSGSGGRCDSNGSSSSGGRIGTRTRRASRAVSAFSVDKSIAVEEMYEGVGEEEEEEEEESDAEDVQKEFEAVSAAVLQQKQAEGMATAAFVGDHTIAGVPMSEWLRLRKPSRYLGNEFGAVHKDWNSARVRFCLTYPEIYEVGASNLGHILLYTVLNRQDRVLCDRAYFVDSDMADCLKRYNLPLFAVESRKPLAAFDTLGFSLSYELGATNILEMLHVAGIPVSWEERLQWEADRMAQRTREKGGDATASREGGEEHAWDVESGDSLPLIFAGGPTATSNPEPFSDFFDFFAIGDGEESLVEIAQCLEACKSERLSRRATLLRLAQSVKGVYVPQLYQQLPGWGAAPLPTIEGVPAKILRRVAMPDPLDQIGLVPFTATVHDRLTVEIRRGCTRGCRFCQPGMLTRPARDVDPDKVVEAVEVGMRKTGYTEFSLLSLSCSDYLALPSVGIQIKNRLKDEPISLSLPSQRVDRFNDDIANIIGGTRKGSLTFAPEAGTQRMRDIINKGLTDEELLRGVKAAWDKGWRQVKLYFMIGLPGETDDDVRGIARTVKWLQSQCRRGRNYIGVKLTISNFTPKPHTPFQWHSVSTEEFTRKQRLLKSELARMPGVRFYFGDVRLSAMEDFIGRGDRSIGAVIRRAWEMGATNDAWWNNVEECYACWSKAIEEQGLQWKYRSVWEGEWDVMEHLGDSRFRGQGGKGRVDTGDMADDRLDAPLPWDIIDTGIHKWWLKADLQRALEATTVPDCSHSGHCSKCGVCEDEFGENIVAPVPDIPPFDGDFKPSRTRAQRIRVRFSKHGSMTLIGHLDLMRLFDRALRRASLPVCFDNGFHSLPRIATALPLPLGHSSTCELVDIELNRKVDVNDFKVKLQSQLPSEVGVVEAWEEPVFRMDGKNEDTLTKLLFAVEYLLAVAVEAQTTTSTSNSSSSSRGSGDSQQQQEQQEEEAGAATGGNDTAGPRAWVQAVNGLQEFCVTTQSRRSKKTKLVDLRSQLHELSVLHPSALRRLPREFLQSCPAVAAAATAPASPAAETAAALGSPAAPKQQEEVVVLRYVGMHSTGEGTLRPEGVLSMLQQMSGRSLRLLHAHRSRLLLRPPSKPKVDHALLRSMANDDAFRSLYRRYDGTSRLHDEEEGLRSSNSNSSDGKHAVGKSKQSRQPRDPIEAARRAKQIALQKA